MKTIKQLVAIIFITVFSIMLFSLTLRGVWGNIDSSKIAFAPTYAGSPFESSHERSPYGLLLSLVENHSFELSQNLANFGSPDIGVLNGKYFSYFPAGVPVILIPFYLYGQQYNLSLLFAYAAVPIFSTLSLIFLFLISKQVIKLSV